MTDSKQVKITLIEDDGREIPIGEAPASDINRLNQPQLKGSTHER